MGIAKYEKVEAPSHLAYYDFVSDKQGRANREIPAPLVEIDFIEVDASTSKLKIKMTYSTKEALDRVLELGLETALVETYEKLDQLLAK